MLGPLLKIRLRTWINSLRRGDKKKRRRRLFGLFGLSLVPVVILINILLMDRAILQFLPDGAQWLYVLFNLSMGGLFLLLLFGGLTVVMHSLFFSKDLSLLLSSPLPLRTVFQLKLIEAVAANSAFYFMLGLPMIIAFGVAFKVSALFYPAALALSLVFITLPIAFSAAMAILLVSIMPARKAKNISTVIFGLMSVVLWGAIQFMRPERIRPNSAFASPEVLQKLTVQSSAITAWIPSQWLSKSLIALQMHDWRSLAIYSAVLIVSAGLFYWAALLMLNGAHRRDMFSGGLSGNRPATIPKVSRREPVSPQRPLWFELALKDFKLLLRDSRHAMQIFLYTVILVVFPIIGSGSNEHIDGPLQPFLANIYLFLFAGMMASSWASRLIPAEGLTFSQILCAPQSLRRILSAKIAVSTALSFACSLIAMVVVHFIKPIPMTAVLQVTVALIFTLFGSSGIGLAVGAFFPNYTWDHPKRMLSGGGNMIYMISILVLFAINAGILILGSFIASLNAALVLLAIFSLVMLFAGTRLAAAKLDKKDWLL